MPNDITVAIVIVPVEAGGKPDLKVVGTNFPEAPEAVQKALAALIAVQDKQEREDDAFARYYGQE